jgi:hypothetical protein
MVAKTWLAGGCADIAAEKLGGKPREMRVAP